MPAKAVLLETPRLRLRQFTDADIDLIVSLDADPQVTRYLSRNASTSREDIANKVLPLWFKFYATNESLGFWALELQVSKDFVGWVHLRPDRLAPDEQELGYRLHPAYWGQGLASEASSAVIQCGFNQYSHEKICARTLATNLASQRVMQKCNMQFESEFVYAETLLPGWSLEERRAVKYSICKKKSF